MFIPKLSLKLSAMGGYSLGLYEGQTDGNLFYAAGAEISYLLHPSFSLGVGAAYKDYPAKSRSLYKGLGVFLGASYTFGAGKTQPNIKIQEIIIDPIFPVFYKHYDTSPMGSISLKNSEKGTIKDVKVSFFSSQYMEKPKVCAVLEELRKDQEADVQLYALFTDKVLDITEGTKVSGDVIIEYSYLDSKRTLEQVETIRMYDRKALTWDDDRKAAAFVTAKDPAILKFAKVVAGNIRGKGTNAINSNFRTALAMFESLALFGMNYVIDPSTPYAEFSQDKLALDYLQFPRQTMIYKAGDCDDLSILNSALLESIGIETAFITVPGHIYLAFSLNMDPDTAKKTFLRPEDLIFQGNNTWVPLEITEVQKGFLKAWQIGAKEWRENEAAGTAAFYPVHQAWEIYEPVGISSSDSGMELPSASKIVSAYTTALNRFIEKEIQEKVQSLRDLIAREGDNPKLINKLGVLLARYGLYDDAEKEFGKVLARHDYVPTLINIGNIYFLRNEMSESLAYYERANKISPYNPVALLGIARTNYELENYSAVNVAYKSMEEKDPSMAVQFSYLVSKSESAQRASAIVKEGAVVLHNFVEMLRRFFEKEYVKLRIEDTAIQLKNEYLLSIFREGQAIENSSVN